MIRRLGRYELIEQVGTGGMAAVYRGRDSALDREVAVKLLHPHLAARPEARARFSREARAVARLAHPGIVEIFDYAGEGARESYLVTEFVRGRTLRAFADAVGLGFPEVGALVARALSDALAHAHGAGVIHRDLKPENVLVAEGGEAPAVKLADFGIARIVAADDRMTMTGALVGSPNHMAPEIIEGKEADARSDIFSLGTLLYWLVTGVLPFAAPNPTATLRRVIEGTYDDPRAVQPLVSDELAAVITRALASDPAGRFGSAAELRDALDAALRESGLDRPVDELSAFLHDPEGYKAALPGRMVQTLVARGEAALARGERARALAVFNRVLALEPANVAVARHLERFALRARWKRAARVGGVAASAAALMAAVVVAVGLLGGRERPVPARGVAGRSTVGGGVPDAARREGQPPGARVEDGGEPVGGEGGAKGEPGSSTSAAQGSGPARGDRGMAAGGSDLGGVGREVDGGVDGGAGAAAAVIATATATPTATATSNSTSTSTSNPTSTGTGTASHSPATPTSTTTRLRPSPRASPPQADVSPTPLSLTVHVRPYAQRALLDGIEVARGEQSVVFALAPGRHRIQIEHACCEPFVRDVDAADAAAGGELRVPLTPRPARLRVEADPATRVFVSGRLLGTAGDSQRAPLAVEVPEGGVNAYEGQAELRLELEGHVPYSTPVRIRAGGDITIAAPRLEDLP